MAQCDDWVQCEDEYENRPDNLHLCRATSRGFECTRGASHSGPHHAHGTDDCYLIWDNDDEPASTPPDDELTALRKRLNTLLEQETGGE